MTKQKGKVKTILIILAILVVGLASYLGCVLYQQRQEAKVEVEKPEVEKSKPWEALPDMSYHGIKCVNCHINPDYPFQTHRELIEIEGKVKQTMGSKMCPWVAVVVNNQILIQSETDTLIHNFENLIGKIITIKGYPANSGQAKVGCLAPPGAETTYKETAITLNNVFYVSEVIGWRNVCCNTLDDAENIKRHNFCFWIEK